MSIEQSFLISWSTFHLHLACIAGDDMGEVFAIRGIDK